MARKNSRVAGRGGEKTVLYYRSSAQRRDRPGQGDPGRRYHAAMGDRFDAPRPGPVEGNPVVRVDVARQREPVSRANLYEKHHHSPVALRGNSEKFFEMLGAARCHRVGELRQTPGAHQVDVFYLHEAGLLALLFQEKVDPRSTAVFYLPSQSAI